MGKKIWYSKPLSDMWSQYKQYYRLYKGSTEEFFYFRNNEIIQSRSSDPEDIQSWTNILDLWRLDTQKRFIHIYFKQKELRDFLENMSLTNLDEIVDFIFQEGETVLYAPSPDTINILAKPVKIQTYNFGIHVPYEKEDKGYAFQLEYNEEKELTLIWAIGTNQGWCSAENYKDNLKGKEEHSDFFARIFRLAINTIAYMKAFPECVKEGVPPTEKISPSFLLETSDKVIEAVSNPDSNRTVSPHFRKGHFKVLRSDYYTHKKGQIIYIPETMVNAVAKTVEKSNDEEKLKKFGERVDWNILN